MKFQNTIIALVLLAGLGGVFYYLTKHPQADTSADASTVKKKLFAFQPDQVKGFSIEIPNQPPISVRRAAQGQRQWEIVSPADVPSDSVGIQAFVDGLSKVQYTVVDSQTPSSLAEFGLDPAQKTFQFELTSGQPVTLRIGAQNPAGFAKYAVLSSAPGLFLLDSIDNKDLIDKTLFDLRDKRILPVDLEKAKQLDLKFQFAPATPAELAKAKKLDLPLKVPKIGMTREANNNWQVTEPPVRTDFGDTNYFITVINGGTMQSVVADDAKSLSAYGLNHPAIRLDVTAADGSLHSLLVGKKKEEEKKPEASPKPGESKPEGTVGYYAKNSDSPAIFTINQSVYDQLNQDLDNYRNRFLFDFDASNARRLEVLGPTGELRLDRKGDDWFKGPDDKAKVDATKVSTFLDAIHALRIQHYTEDQPGHLAEYGLDKPWLKVKVTFGEANKEETIVFGQKNKKFYAAREDSPSVYELAPTEPDALQPKLKDIS